VPAAKPMIEALRRDVQQILRAAPNAKNASLPIHAADLGLGGVSAMLASLERSIVFEQVKDEEFEGKTYRVVQGRWNPERLASIFAQMGPAVQQLEAFVPDRVRIYFESETLFPVRIMYLKQTSPERRTFRPMVTLEFHDVEFDAPLPADTFTYQPPSGVEETDDTANFIRLLQGPPAAGSPPTASQTVPRP
jgi:hypothetical protein